MVAVGMFFHFGGFLLASGDRASSHVSFFCVGVVFH